MSENPLLPRHKLQELYSLMERVGALERKHRKGELSREAVLAAASIQFAPGDLLLADRDDRTAAALAPAPKQTVAGAHPFTPSISRLLAGAAMARGLQASGGNGAAIVLAQARTRESGWAEALAWAQTERLPFVLVCTDPFALEPTPARLARNPDTLTPEAVQAAARRISLPILTVDGEDAVAMFRAVQESTLRVRSNAGPSLIWAALGAQPEGASRSQKPLVRLRRYLRARGIEPQR